MVKKTTKKKAKKTSKEEVREVFDVKKKGKIVSIEKKGKIKKETISPVAKKEQIKQENKLLRNILIFVGVLVVVIVLVVLFVKSIRNFEYEGVDFEVVQEGELILHRTSIPVIYQGEEKDYNFYLRNDPRKSKVDFNEELILMENAVLNMSQDFNCDGEGVIAIANLVQLYRVAGINLMQDENANCDSNGQYMFISIKEGEETRMEKVGPVCYDLYVNNCEILEVTEKLMVETFIELNKLM